MPNPHPAMGAVSNVFAHGGNSTMTIIENDSVTTIHPDGSVTVGGPAEAQASRAMMQAQMNDMTMQMQASMGGMNRRMSGMNRSMSGMNLNMQRQVRRIGRRMGGRW